MLFSDIMKKNRFFLGLFLISLSLLLHGAHYVIFKDVHHIMIFLLADIAFVPLEVFFVSMVLDQMIEKREHQQVLKKINMIVGLFYQELGNKLLAEIVKGNDTTKLQNINVDLKWDDDKYSVLEKEINNHSFDLDLFKIDLDNLDNLISRYQQLVTNIITNPVIHEHELFTDVIMSIFHLSEELKQRPEGTRGEHDVAHLKVDLERVYKNLSLNWVEYLKYLQIEYPYLFLSAVTNNPFDNRERDVIEKELLSVY